MAYYRKRNYRRRQNRYRSVRRFNSNRRYKKTKNSLSYKVYNLTRKVNRYIATYKPEIQQVRTNMIDTDFKVDGALQPIGNGYQNLYEQTLRVYREAVDQRILNIQGELCRSYKLRLFGYFGLCPVDHYYYHEADDEDYYTKDPYPHTCYLKLVIASLKKGGGRVPQPNEVFVSTKAEGMVQPGFRDLTLITGPLQKNITSQLNILRTKVVKVDANTPQKLFKINLKVPHYRKRVNANAYGAGEILVYYQLLCPTILGNPENPHAPDPRLTVDCQLLYVDQN